MSFYSSPPFANIVPMVGFSPALPSQCRPVREAPMLGHIKSEVGRPTMETSDYQSSDPVTKAVMDNIMGKLPTKKQAVTTTCDICKLEFSGQIVLDMHLAGAKHARKLKSQEILAQLQTTGETFTADEKAKIVKCEICNIVVNSTQQLQTHLSGNKHKQKAQKMSMKALPTSVPPTNGNGTFSKPMQQSSVPANSATQLSMTIEGSGTTAANGRICVADNKSKTECEAKTKKHFCDTCNIPLNSDAQLEQHLGSRKHKDKLSKPKKARPTPYWRKQRSCYKQDGQEGADRVVPKSEQYHNPLSSNFVSSGSFTGF